jgi:hypothetical protein
MANTIDLATVLIKKYHGSEWNLNGDDYAGLVWLSDTPKPSKKELEDLWPTVLAEIAAELESEKTAKAELLARLGITAEEAVLLLK